MVSVERQLAESRDRRDVTEEEGRRLAESLSAAEEAAARYRQALDEKVCSLSCDLYSLHFPLDIVLSQSEHLDAVVMFLKTRWCNSAFPLLHFPFLSLPLPFPLEVGHLNPASGYGGALQTVEV